MNLADPIHQQILGRLKIFLICGGMPEAVSQYVRKRDLLNGGLVLNDLITVLKTDFMKYKKRTPLLLLNEVFESVMRQTEGKFVYERAAPGKASAAVRQALELLSSEGFKYNSYRSEIRNTGQYAEPSSLHERKGYSKGGTGIP